MKNIELKNCPNCHERIGVQDIECPYCKWIDDPKYKKQNQRLLKSKKKNRKNDIYRTLLIIPIIIYLCYLLINMDLSVIIIPLILLNVMCFFTKRSSILWTIIIEIIAISFNFIYNIAQVSLVNYFKEIIIFVLGIIFIIVPKIIFVLKTKKKRKRKK